MTKNKNNTRRQLIKNNTKLKLNTKSNTNVEKGGNILASGGFGCVFSPALICQEKKNDQ